MVIVNNQSSAVRVQVAVPLLETRSLASEGAAADSSDTNPETQVSNLARQLSAAAVRAQDRDATLDPQALSQKAKQALSELSSSTADSQAFKGMPRDQLALIAYDDGGEFSVGERALARQEAAEQEQLWRKSATTRALSEYSATGNMTGFFSEALTHFKSLPAIEQAQYPAGFATDLQRKAGEQLLNPQEEITKALPETAYTKLIAAEANLYATKNSTAATLGRELLVSRLFDGREPRVVSGEHGMSIENIYRSPYEFLTREDRELFSEVYYSYAQDQDVDLGYVDDVINRLARYRQYNDGRILANINNGNCFDSQGRQLSVRFNERDSAAASRILYGSAINSTRLDQGFLRFTLDPGFEGIGHRSDLRFLEHVVNRFSATAGPELKLDECFSAYPVGEIPVNSILTASSEVMVRPRGCGGASEEDGAADLANERTPVAEPERLELEGFFGKQGGLFMMLQNMKARANIWGGRPSEAQGVEGQLPMSGLVSRPRIK